MPIPRDRNLEFRVRIWDDDDEPVDVTNFVRSARWGLGDVSAVGTGALGVDATVATASVTLLRDESLVELFRDYARIVIEARVTPSGSTPGSLETVFDGFLGDGFRWAGSNIELTARDPAKLLQDTQVDSITTFGSEEGTAAEVVIQQLMTHHLGGNAPTLYCPVSPVALVGPFIPRDQSVWDAIQGIVARFGWYLGYLRADGQYRLTLLEPPRDGPTTTLSIDWADMFSEDLTWSTRDVRNSVTIEYFDTAADEVARYSAEDAWSIANVTGGVRKHSHIVLARDSGVNTAAEAERLADAFLADLSRVLANTQIELPFNPSVQLFTGLTVLNPARSASSASYAVNSVEHRITIPQTGGNASFRTVALAAGHVIGGKRKWLDREPRPGSPGDTGSHTTQLFAPTLAVGAAAPGITILIAELSPDAAGVEVHVSSTPGFTPGEGSFVGRGQSGAWVLSTLTPGTTYYVRAREFDDRSGTGPWSAEVSAAAGSVGTAELDPSVSADLAYAVIQAQVVEAREAAWDATTTTVTDSAAFWDAAAAQLDGTLEAGTVTSSTSVSVTQTGKDWPALGVMPGDQLRIVGGNGAGQVRVVEAASGGTITVSEAFDPAPAAGSNFEVGRTTVVTARAETALHDLTVSEVGRVELDLQGDALDSNYNAVRESAELASRAVQRQDNHLLLTGILDNVTSSTIEDSNGNFVANGILPGDVIVMMDGDAAGIQMDVAAVSAFALTIAQAWPMGRVPSMGDSYVVGRPQSVSTSYSEQTAEGFTNIVTKLNSDADASGQFTAIEQLATGISIIAGQLDSIESGYALEPMTTVNGEAMQTVDGVTMTTSVVQGLAAVFTAIALNQNQIDLVANQSASNFAQIQVNSNAILQRVTTGAFNSTISQLSDEIDLKVNANGVISAINVSPESIRLDSNRIHLSGDTTVDGSFTVGGPGASVEIDDGAITTDKLTAGEIDISRNDRATGRINAKDTSNNTQAAFGDITDLPGVPSLGAARKYGMWVRRGTGLIIPGEYYEANTYYYNHVFTATTGLSSATDYIELAPGGNYTGHPGTAGEPPNAWVRVSCSAPSYYPDPPSRPAGAWRFGVLGVRIQYRTRPTSSSAWGSWTQYVGPFETLASHQSELRVRVPVQYVGDTVPVTHLRVRAMVNILVERAYKE